MVEIKLPEIKLPEGSIEFFQRILGPVAEVGDFLSDKIRFYRWKSSFKMLEKAQKIAAENGVKVNQIPLKILVPLLEKASLEEEDSPLLDRWANLMASASKNVEYSHAIFSDVLSKLSAEEVKALDDIVPRELVSKIIAYSDPEIDRNSYITIITSARVDARYSFVKKTCRDLIGASSAIEISDDIEKEVHKIVRANVEPFIEYITVNFDNSRKGIYRYTDIFDQYCLDILSSSGLISRSRSSIDLVGADLHLSVIVPTSLGVKFVMACRGDDLAAPPTD